MSLLTMDGGICTFILLDVVTGTAVRLFFLLEISGSITSCPSFELFPLFPAFGNSIGPDALTCSNALPHPRPLPWASSCSSPQAGRQRRGLRLAADRENPGESAEGAWGCKCGVGPVPAEEVRDGDSRGPSEARKSNVSNGWQQVLQPTGRGLARTAASRPRPLAAAALPELESARARAHGGHWEVQELRFCGSR